MNQTVAVKPDQLVRLRTERPVVLVDCRFSLTDPQLGYQQYLQGHIPGAYYLDLNQHLSSPVEVHGGRHPLPDLSVFAAQLSRMGVTAQTLVVAYDDSRFAFASRLWWLLRYMGHSQAVVLEGGFAAYQAVGLPIATDIPPECPGQFIPQVNAGLAIDIHGVQQRQSQPQVVLVDSREGDRYRGEREPIDPVAGHIPGAMNYPWQEITDEKGFLRSPEALRTYWSAVTKAEEVVVYCGSGVTACVNLLGMAAAGLTTGKLYVGSWSDWCSYPLDENGQAQLALGERM
ncbi:MAG: sulfurtransferase [Thermosynechococcaceae cyanobacterium]